MLTLKLPDGSHKQFPPKTTPRQVAESIGKRWPRPPSPPSSTAKSSISTASCPRSMKPKPKVSLRKLRRRCPGTRLSGPDREGRRSPGSAAPADCAHVMARAVMRLFPGAQLAFGPTVENGFYYDIDVDPPIREEDFPRIEAEMRKIVDKPSRSSASNGPSARPELCAGSEPGLQGRAHRRRTEAVSDPQLLPPGRVHRPVPRPAHAARRQDRRVQAAEHRRGVLEERRHPQAAPAALRHRFLHPEGSRRLPDKLEEAKKRDHRVLGKQLKLFTISPLVGSGLILWMPTGATVRGMLETFIKDELVKRGYQPVYTPHIGRLELYRTSGHFPYYRDAQFPPMYFRPAAGALDLAQWRLANGRTRRNARKHCSRTIFKRQRISFRATRKPIPTREAGNRPRPSCKCSGDDGHRTARVSTRHRTPRSGPTSC